MFSVMNTSQFDTTAGAKSPKTKSHLSKDGKWRYFDRIPGLVQYVVTGTYYAKCKAYGKSLRKSLETDVLTTAKDKLPFKLREMRKPRAAVGTFAEARVLYEADLENDHTLSVGTKNYYKDRLAALVKSWPELETSKLNRITESNCREWARRFASQFDEQNFNNTLGVLRQILKRGGLGTDENPALKLDRLGVRPTELHLPEPDQFEKLVELVEKAGARQSRDCADLIRFLAFSGCRIGEARKVTWADVDFEKEEIRVWNGKRSKKSNHPLTRQVPFICGMREFLEKLLRQQNPQADDRVCILGECEKSLTRACEKLGIFRITHHDLRHLFATRCIEAGVDIPTVARWLGHVDGGALAMKTYGHLRRTHSKAMAQKVTFRFEVVPASTPAASEPVATPKIQIGGKEYTEAEILAKLQAVEQQAKTPGTAVLPMPPAA
jgi:integrase